MKAIPAVAVLLSATAAVASAGPAETTRSRPGITILRPPAEKTRNVARTVAADSQSATAAADPRVQLTGPAEVAQFDPVAYELRVSNDGDADLSGPFTVEFEGSGAFDAATITGNGWTCSLLTHTCDWPGDLLAGAATAPAVFEAVADPPHGATGSCPERAPCVFLRALVTGYPDGLGVLGTAVIVDGHAPPDAIDDFVWMPAPPAPIVVDATANDRGEMQGQITDIVSFPAHGTAAISADNTILYTPDPTFAGSDSFRYLVSDQNGTDSATVHVGTLVGGISFLEPLLDVGQVEIAHVAMAGTHLQNDTGVVLEGTVSVSPVPAGEVAAVLAGTGYDPSLVAFDPFVFKPVDGQAYSTFNADLMQFTTLYTRPLAPLGTIWLARFRYDLHPVGSPTAVVTASIDVVARAATAAEAPIHVVDDVATVPPDVPTMLRPLANDSSAAGNVLSVTAIYSADPWFLDPDSAVGQFQFADPQGPNGTLPYHGILYTPPPGYTGTNAFFYAASEYVNFTFRRYDFAKFTLHVSPLPPPPPVAVASGSATVCAGGSTPLSGSGGVSCSWSPATGLDDAASCTPSASPASTTTYTLTVVAADGQMSTNNPTVTVTVEPLPTAVASGSATIILGQSAPLSGSGGVSCAWSPATGLDDAASCAPIASPTLTTTYALVVTSVAGCASTNPASATITVIAPPVPPDLVIAAVVAPSRADSGDTITVSVQTANNGGGAAAASTTGLFFSVDRVIDAGDVVVGAAAVPALNAGQSATTSFTFTIPSGSDGKFYLIARADDAGVVTETNEVNNITSEKLQVKKVR